MKLKLLIIIFFIFLYSCKKQVTVSIDINPQYKIKIDTYSNTKKSLSNYISNEFTFLELIDIPIQDFISKIDKIEFYNDKYFILDIAKSNLIVLNEKGKFVNKIGKRGNGPGEFKTANDFIINQKTNEIVVLAEQNASLFIFDLNGNFKKKIRYDDFFPRKIALVGNNYVIFTSYGSNSFHDLIYTDYNGKVIGKGFKYPEEVDDIGFEFTGGIKTFDNKTFYSRVTSSIIFEIGDDFESFAKYQIDLGAKQWLESDKYELHRFSNQITRMETSFLQNDYFEKDNILHFDYAEGNKNKRGFYNLITNTLYTSDSFTNDGIIRLLDNVVGVKDDHLIASFNPQYYEGISNYYDGFKESLMKLNPNLFKGLESIDEDSNPILIFFKYYLNE